MTRHVYTDSQSYSDKLIFFIKKTTTPHVIYKVQKYLLIKYKG